MNPHKDNQEALRVRNGLQCPECYGVRIETQHSAFSPRPEGFLCIECGCEFSPPIRIKP